MVDLSSPDRIALALVGVRSVESLLYQVKGSDPEMLLIPALLILTIGGLAAIPAVIRAIRIDPVATLRAE